MGGSPCVNTVPQEALLPTVILWTRKITQVQTWLVMPFELYWNCDTALNVSKMGNLKEKTCIPHFHTNAGFRNLLWAAILGAFLVHKEQHLADCEKQKQEEKALPFSSVDFKLEFVCTDTVTYIH